MSGRCEIEFAIAKSQVIVMVKGKLPSKEKMPESVYNYIKTNMYLTSSDPDCLEKLRQLIPLQESMKAIPSQQMAQSGPIAKPSEEGQHLFEMDTMTYQTEIHLENQVKMTRNEGSGMINLDLFLNDQASHLSYNSKHEVDQSKFQLESHLVPGFQC